MGEIGCRRKEISRELLGRAVVSRSFKEFDHCFIMFDVSYSGLDGFAIRYSVSVQNFVSKKRK